MRLAFKYIIIIFLFINHSCNKNNENRDSKIVSPIIINFDNKIAFNTFKKLNLDSTYTNLLNPNYSSEEDYKEVLKSWTSFHKKVSKFIEEEKFSWDIPDSTISIVNRIYFNKKGAIDYYSFKILNPSITNEKKIEYEKVLQKFSKNVTINLKKDEQFAQCGKIKYLNY